MRISRTPRWTRRSPSPSRTGSRARPAFAREGSRADADARETSIRQAFSPATSSRPRWPRGSPAGSRRRRRRGRRHRVRAWCRRRSDRSAGLRWRDRRKCRWPTRGPRRTSVCPSVVIWACRRLTPESLPQSISGLMLRLADLRPTRTDALRSGTTSGRPGEGSGSGLSCASYQAGSIQTSATQSDGRGATAVVGLSAGLSAGFSAGLSVVRRSSASLRPPASGWRALRAASACFRS